MKIRPGVVKAFSASHFAKHEDPSEECLITREGKINVLVMHSWR